MGLNLIFQIFFSALAVSSLVVLRLPPDEAIKYDRWIFCGGSTVMLAFCAFRPMGVGVDDLGGYADYYFDLVCPTLQCGKLIQGERDQAWYTIVGFLKSVYSLPQVVLWLAGLGLAVKIWVIYRLCKYRTLALVFYLACFYIIHDITALRVSLAISVYMLAFYYLVAGRAGYGGALLTVNGLFHMQAYVAPLILMGRWMPLNLLKVRIALLAPLIFLMMGVYLGDGVLSWLMERDWGQGLVRILFHGYELQKFAGNYAQTRIWPIVVPPTLFLAAWLIGDLLYNHQALFKYSAMSLTLAVLFLWGYAVVPEVQMRFWHYFLVPIIFLIGNAEKGLWRQAAVLALSTVYLLKYTVMHDLLLD